MRNIKFNVAGKKYVVVFYKKDVLQHYKRASLSYTHFVLLRYTFHRKLEFILQRLSSVIEFNLALFLLDLPSLSK